MNAAASHMPLSSDPFSIASAAQAQVLTKLTRADMHLILPRLDDVIDPTAPDAKEATKKLQDKIERCKVIYRIAGHVTRHRITKGRGDKDGVQFIGEFEARFSNDWGGKRFYSGRAHVPGSLEEMLYTQLVDAKKVDEDASIDFLVDIGIKPPTPGKVSAVGYEWTVTPLVEVERISNPVQTLFDRFQQRALAAPVSASAAPATETATAAEAAPAAAGKHKK